MAAMSRRSSSQPIVMVLIVVGLVALAVGLVYLAVPVSKLPTWLPGHIAGKSYHHVRRAVVAIVVAVLCGIGAWLLAGRRQTRAYR